jgi:hypothetical protein
MGVYDVLSSRMLINIGDRRQMNIGDLSLVYNLVFSACVTTVSIMALSRINRTGQLRNRIQAAVDVD